MYSLIKLWIVYIIYLHFIIKFHIIIKDHSIVLPLFSSSASTKAEIVGDDFFPLVFMC